MPSFVPARVVKVVTGPRALRVLSVLLLGLSLLEPTLRVMTVAPQQTFVGVLIDDSLSLTIKDEGGRARAQPL